MFEFMQQQGFDDYSALYQWSITESPAFWCALCKFCGIEMSREADNVLARPDSIIDAGWFDGAELNFASHMLRHTGDRAAIVFCGEDGARRELSRDALRDGVARLAQSMRALGVKNGDRVAGYLPNCP